LTYFGETALFADFGETALFADFGETALFADFGETIFFYTNTVKEYNEYKLEYILYTNPNIDFYTNTNTNTNPNTIISTSTNTNRNNNIIIIINTKTNQKELQIETFQSLNIQSFNNKPDGWELKHGLNMKQDLFILFYFTFFIIQILKLSVSTAITIIRCIVIDSDNFKFQIKKIAK